jgi:hypothetical protein
MALAINAPRPDAGLTGSRPVLSGDRTPVAAATSPAPVVAGEGLAVGDAIPAARLAPIAPVATVAGGADSAPSSIGGGSAPMAALPWHIALPLLMFLLLIGNRGTPRAPDSPAYDPAIPPI